MLNDFINLTPGQLLVKYWWLWLFAVFIAVVFEISDRLKKG